MQNYSYENECHLYVHSLENQVIFMRNVLHEHLFERVEATAQFKAAYEPSGPSGWHLFRFQ